MHHYCEICMRRESPLLIFCVVLSCICWFCAVASIIYCWYTLETIQVIEKQIKNNNQPRQNEQQPWERERKIEC